MQGSNYKPQDHYLTEIKRQMLNRATQALTKALCARSPSVSAAQMTLETNGLAAWTSRKALRSAHIGTGVGVDRQAQGRGVKEQGKRHC